MDYRYTCCVKAKNVYDVSYALEGYNKTLLFFRLINVLITMKITETKTINISNESSGMPILSKNDNAIAIICIVSSYNDNYYYRLTNDFPLICTSL